MSPPPSSLFTGSEESRDVGRVLRATSAARGLRDLLLPSPAGTLRLQTADLRLIDAYGAAVLLSAIEEHHSAGRAVGGVQLVRPEDSAARARLVEFLTFALPLPACWPGEGSLTGRDPDILQPAWIVGNDRDGRLIGEEALDRAMHVKGWEPRCIRALQGAARELLQNAWQHGGRSPCPPVLAACFEPQGQDLQVVVLDRAPDWPTGPNGARRLRARLRKAEKRHDGSSALADLVALRRGGFDSTVRLMWGTARASRRTGGEWKTWTATEVPGFVAGFELHTRSEGRL